VRNPYDVLGVSPSASADEIKAAFRKKAREHHPDQNHGDERATERFQEINAAYQVLGDPERRAQFDHMGAARQQSFAGRGVSVEDWLADILGAFSQTRHQETGDAREVVELDFEEAALGCTRTITYQRRDTCETCNGTGGDPSSGSVRCPSCDGRGRIHFGGGILFGAALEQACPRCSATGRIYDSVCRDCAGAGVATKTRTIEVTLPPGIESGAAQTLVGGGSRPSPAAPVGDLELVIRVRPHSVFRREGDDVLVDLDVPFAVATLGGRVEVDSLGGRTRVRVAPGTQAGSVLRLRGKGVPHRFRPGAGDQLCVARVRVPENLSPRAVQLVRQLDQELARPGSYGFWAWVRAIAIWIRSLLFAWLPRAK
jgi:molecular chaperone DnaJ